MKHSWIAILLIALFATTTLFASEPFPIPTDKLPPAYTPAFNVPPHVAPEPLPDPSGPMTLERLERSGARGPIYYNLRRQLLLKQQGVTSLDDGPADPAAALWGEFQRRIGTLATVGTTQLTSNDGNQDAEPAVVAVKIGTTDYTVSGMIKYIPVGTHLWPRNHVSFSTNSGAFSTPVQLPLAPGYEVSADPLFSVNPYSGGIAPRRIYCVGVMTVATANPPSAIGVWRSDNGGQTWAGPTIVASRPAGGHYLDKPAITVSWHSGTLGHVYVAFVDRDETAGNERNSSLLVYRSTDGGLTFPTFNAVVIEDVQSPQLVVNPNAGTLHCMWLDMFNNDLRSAYTVDNNLTFSPHEIASTGGNLLTFNTQFMLNGQVKALSLPMARYNHAAGRVIMAYHGWNAAHTNTDIFYVYRPCSANCNGYGWEVPQRVNDLTARDKFMPGIDFKSSGNVVITFYDRRDDPNNIAYHEYFAYLNASGSPIHNNVRVSTFATDPRFYTGDTGYASFIGDYQDCWDWTYTVGENAVAAWIGIPSAGNGNGYASRIIY